MAEERPTIAVDFDGCAPIVDTAKTLSELGLDLGADQLLPTTVVAFDPLKSAGMRITARCADNTLEVVLRIDQHEPESLFLTDTSGTIRSRTLALAMAERVRQVRLEPPPAPPQPPTPAVETSTRVAEIVQPRLGAFRNPERMRLEGNIALARVTFAGFAVGAPITAVGDANANRGDLRGPGAVILGVSCAPLVGAAVAFGFWMHERSLPAP
jgi:hypothetical protein